MIVLVCIDNNAGMMFNHRRQSQDKKLREYILQVCNGKNLWMNHYSAKQFSDVNNIIVDDECLSKAGSGDFCFIEDQPVLPYEQQIEKIILFKWNRSYPTDQYFDIPLSEHHWKCIQTTDFVGNSHDKITMEVYEH